MCLRQEVSMPFSGHVPGTKVGEGLAHTTMPFDFPSICCSHRSHCLKRIQRTIANNEAGKERRQRTQAIWKDIDENK